MNVKMAVLNHPYAKNSPQSRVPHKLFECMHANLSLGSPLYEERIWLVAEIANLAWTGGGGATRNSFLMAASSIVLHYYKVWDGRA